MTPVITAIPLGFVNAYLIKTDTGFVLIDTGMGLRRAALEKALAGAGCGPGDLRLIVVTHADADHTGNCAYLREKYGAQVALHPNEAAMAAGGNMLASRRPEQTVLTRLLMRLLSLVFALKPSDRFRADVILTGGENLSSWGLDAKVLHLPGHSTGSIGVLTAAGDLFCGDLINNYGKPQLHIVDDWATARASLEKLKGCDIKTVYPGHGKPFAMEALAGS